MGVYNMFATCYNRIDHWGSTTPVPRLPRNIQGDRRARGGHRGRGSPGSGARARGARGARARGARGAAGGEALPRRKQSDHQRSHRRGRRLGD